LQQKEKEEEEDHEEQEEEDDQGNCVTVMKTYYLLANKIPLYI
jgi:hypothetical protein